jgi:hypothetical protein
MKKLLFACIGLVLIGVSCKKSDPAPTPTPATKFMTFTSGTSWNYQTDSAGITLSQYTLTSSSSDTSISNKSYHIFHSDDGTNVTSEYYNITNSDYYQYSQLSAQLPPVDLRYLNDSLPVGSNWSQPISITQSGVTLNASIKTTVEATGTSLTVNNVNYIGAIKMKTEIVNLTSSNPLVTVSIPTQSIHSYFAPKYGLIQRDFALHVVASVFGTSSDVINTNTTTMLMSSTVQ